MIKKSEFLEELQSAVRNNRILLPTLPEVALNVRDAVEKESVTAKGISDIIATDAALSARLLQVANSPLYRGRVPIENIQMAVTRLGNRLVKCLVVSLIMKQIFQATSEVLDKRLRKLWEDSVQIAAISRVLAQQLPHLEPEQAMLAGLIHNIGALPILAIAEGTQELVEDEKQLDQLIEQISPLIGQQILKTWRFSDRLVDIPANFQNLQYDGGDRADYVDIVIVARLQLRVDETSDVSLNWAQIPAFAKVGLEPEINIVDIEGAAENISEVGAIFNG